MMREKGGGGKERKKVRNKNLILKCAVRYFVIFRSEC